MINKSLILKRIILILFVFIGICLLYYVINKNKDIAIGSVEKINIVIKEEDLTVEIDENEDIQIIVDIINKHPLFLASPSCPFGYVEIILETENRKFVFFPATDSCHYFKNSAGRNFEVTNEEWEYFINVLKRYNIDRVLLENRNI